ncbi:MAG: hypothetical protein C0504_13155 [Candidatus Solibacter sp.]|nr:hypothetical protein [Candidatus Solibacter sp.]
MKSRIPAVAAALGLAVAGCTVNMHGDHSRKTETASIERPKAELVDVTVAMAAGEMELSGGSSKLMEGTFTYTAGGNTAPEVHYEDSSFRGRLSVRNKSKTAFGNNHVNRWEIKLADDVRMDLNVSLGAGESRLNLGSLTLRSARVQVGAGQVDLDLRGPKKSSCDVEIRGGVGEATVWVPNDVGVVAEARGGIGEVSVRGLTRDGGRWTNDAYGKSPVTLRLDVKGGIGQINIRAE